MIPEDRLEASKLVGTDVVPVLINLYHQTSKTLSTDRLALDERVPAGAVMGIGINKNHGGVPFEMELDESLLEPRRLGEIKWD
jgi:hypothetical protein